MSSWIVSCASASCSRSCLTSASPSSASASARSRSSVSSGSAGGALGRAALIGATFISYSVSPRWTVLRVFESSLGPAPGSPSSLLSGEIPRCGAISVRTLATVLWSTAHTRAISRLDHAAQSGSDSIATTARRLSSFVRRSPCVAFAPNEWSIASRRVPTRRSTSMSRHPMRFVAATRWKPSASQYVPPSLKTVTGGRTTPASIASAYSATVGS